MPLTKRSMMQGGEAPASPPSEPVQEGKPMAKVKVRVLYPTVLEALGLPADAEEVSIEEDQANDLIAQGYAELVKAKAAK